MKHPPRTLIADDHPVFVEGLKSILPNTLVNIVGTAYNGKSLTTIIEQREPELLLLDLNLPGMSGLEVLDWIQQNGFDLKTLVITMYGQPKLVRKAMDKGANGYLLKDEHIIDIQTAIQSIFKGHVYLGSGLNEAARSLATMRGKAKNEFKDDFLPRQRLTKREMEVLNLITQALNNKQIGEQLFISDQTVGVHRKNIMRKLGVSNTAGLIKLAFEHHLVE